MRIPMHAIWLLLVVPSSLHNILPIYSQHTKHHNTPLFPRYTLDISYPLDYFRSQYNLNVPAVYNEHVASKTSYPAFSLSQYGEDKWIYEHFFYGMTLGTILESGALDGIEFSTSWLFHHFAAWSVIHVEASSHNFAKLQAKRPNAINIRYALCDSFKMLHFVGDDGSDGATSGLVENMHFGHLAMFHPHLERNGKKNFTGLREMPCGPLTPLLQHIGLHHIDLWVLDVEGSELAALQGVNFESITINVIAMECDARDGAVDQAKVDLLEAKGFSCQIRVYPGYDCICKHKDFLPSTKPGIRNLFD